MSTLQKVEQITVKHHNAAVVNDEEHNMTLFMARGNQRPETWTALVKNDLRFSLHVVHP